MNQLPAYGKLISDLPLHLLCLLANYQPALVKPIHLNKEIIIYRTSILSNPIDFC